MRYCGMIFGKFKDTRYPNQSSIRFVSSTPIPEHKMDASWQLEIASPSEITDLFKTTTIIKIGDDEGSKTLTAHLTNLELESYRTPFFNTVGI